MMIKVQQSGLSAIIIGLIVASAAPETAWAAPRLRCSLDQGGMSQVIEVAPVSDPYSVKPININRRFRFKAVVIGDEQRIEYVKLYTYYQTKRQWVLLHEASYLAPEPQAGQSSTALTGQNSLYSPGYEREFQYRCALFEVAP